MANNIYFKKGGFDMKKRFNRSISIFLSIALAISVLALPNIFNATAIEPTTQMSAKQTTYSFNDYSNASTTLSGWSMRKYRGDANTAVDPDDADNKLVEIKNNYGLDTSVIYLSDEYTAVKPSKFFKPTAGTTYTISFRWKYSGTQGNGKRMIGIGLAQDPGDGDDTRFNASATILEQDSVQVVSEVAAGTYDVDWITETVSYTVPETADLETYPNLVLYTLNTTSLGDICYYFDDISVYTLAKYTETLCAENDYTTASTELDIWAMRKYRGEANTTIDPDDADNKLVEIKNNYGLDTSVIYLSDEYTAVKPSKFFKPTAGTTYTISFRWKYSGTQGNGKRMIGIGLAQDPGDGDDTRFNASATILEQDSVQVVSEVAAGTYDVDWITETVSYTVPETADLETYPNLVLYTLNTTSLGDICYYFDDITVKSVVVEPIVLCDEIVSYNDFSTANTNVTQWGVQKYRGNSFVGIDPDNSSNKVVQNQAGNKDLGVIYPSDAYISSLPTNFIKAIAGTTYTITFKWKYNGTQKSGETKIGVGLAQTPVDSDDGSKFSYPNFTILDSDSKQVITSVAAGTYSDIEWKTERISYTVSDNADLLTYPNLVIYTENTNSAADIAYYFDDITIYGKLAPATVNFIYEGNAASNFATVEKSVFFDDGKILDYQPEELPVGVKWYTDSNFINEYDFTKDYTEYMDITLYGVSQYVKGDVNADGSLNSLDLISMRKYFLEGLMLIERLYDVNNDGKFDILDLVRLKKKIVYPEVNELSTVTLSLYGEEGDTYSYGVSWQSDVKLSAPVVEIMSADETDWSGARKIVGTTSDSVAHQTFQIKDGWDYDTISTAYSEAGGTGAWYHSGITTSHDVITIYSNKLIVSGLTPGQNYKYRVGDALYGKYSEEGSFTAYDDTVNDFDFIYMADSQQTFSSSNVNAWKNTLSAAFTSMENAEFIAMGGDLINWSSIHAQWKGLIEHNKDYVMNIPLMPTAGNHELNMTWSGTGIEYYDFSYYFNLPFTSEYDDIDIDKYYKNGATGIYYSYDYKNVHFVVLNTNDIYISSRAANKGKYVLGDSQMAWLNADLTDAKQREENGEIDFTIVYMHAGLYTTGGAGLGSDYKETVDLYEQLQGVFAENNVDLVLSGHDHVYSRTKVLDKDGSVSENGGVVYMSAGVAGINAPGIAYFEKSDNINEGASKYNTADKYEYYAKESYKNCWTELSVNSNKICVSTYCAGSETAIDSFEVSKNNIG